MLKIGLPPGPQFPSAYSASLSFVKYMSLSPFVHSHILSLPHSCQGYPWSFLTVPPEALRLSPEDAGQPAFWAAGRCRGSKKRILIRFILRNQECIHHPQGFRKFFPTGRLDCLLCVPSPGPLSMSLSHIPLNSRNFIWVFWSCWLIPFSE